MSFSGKVQVANRVGARKPIPPEFRFGESAICRLNPAFDRDAAIDTDAFRWSMMRVVMRNEIPRSRSRRRSSIRRAPRELRSPARPMGPADYRLHRSRLTSYPGGLYEGRYR